MLVASSSTCQHVQSADSVGNTDPLCHDQDKSESIEEGETTPRDPVQSHKNWEHRRRHVLDVPKVGDTNDEF